MNSQKVETPQAIKDMICKVVEQDEGGWVLTNNPNDPDGGWTFGGLTAKTFADYFPNGNIIEMKKSIETGIGHPELIETWIDTGIEIYYEKFYLPLSVNLTNRKLLQVELSCGINCGVEMCRNISQATPKIDNYIEDFCKAWIDHYVQLVVKNAKAWQDYANPPNSVKKPATLRAEFLQGWVNRVWRYMP